MTGRNVVVALSAALLLTPLTAVPAATGAVAAPGTYCALDGTPGLTTYRWTGAARDSLWRTGGNWEGGVAPDLTQASTGYVCIDAAHDEDPTSDVVQVVERSANTTTATDATSAMIQALDLASGTLSINRAGKLWLYGDQATRPSVVRPDARLELTMGTLGGSGLLDVEGEMVWTAAQFSSSLKSSCRGIAADDPGGQPGPADTLPQYCPPAADPVDGAGLLVVTGSLTVRSGVFDDSGDLVEDGLARGVNLAQRYGIQVAAGGEVRLLGDAYVAQSHTSRIEVLEGGTWTFDGDADVLEGFFEGTPDGPLPPFVNHGTVRKSAGAGASSIDTAYTGDGAVVVGEGALTTPGGFPVPADVAAGRRVGSWTCPRASFGSAAPDCDLDSAADTTLTTPQDPQAAVVTLPPLSAARVEVRETGEQGPTDLQPQFVISSPDLGDGRVAKVGFELNKTIPGLPAKADLSLYRKAGAANWQEVPPCRHAAGEALPRGVTACVRESPRDRTTGFGVFLGVETTRLRGRWVLRSRLVDPDADPRPVVPTGPGDTTFTYLGGLPAPAEPLVVAGGACGTREAGAWELHRLVEDAGADDHSVGWHRDATGEARGFSVPVGDLADVAAFAGGLRVESGQPHGFARLVRHESGGVEWRGLAEVGLADTDPAADGWRLVQGALLTYRWQRFVGDVRDDTPAFEATLEDFLAEQRDKVRGTPADRVGFAYGCAGEQVQQNDLVVRKVVGDAEDPWRKVAWDLEAPATSARILFEDLGIGSRCQLARPTWPNVVTQGVSVTAGARWLLEWAASDRGPWTPLRRPGGASVVTGVGTGSAVRVPFQLPGAGGVIRVRVPTTHDYRKTAGEPKWFKAVPALDLQRITRRLYVGQSVRLVGRVRPAAARQLELWTVRPGRSVLGRVPARFAVERSGRFTVSYRVSSTGRHGFAVRVAGDGGRSAAMGREVFFTRVRTKPEPPPPPAPAPPPVVDQATVDDRDSDHLDPIERAHRAPACTYVVAR